MPRPLTRAAALAALLAASVGHAQDGAFDGPRIAAIVGVDETDSAPGRGAQSGFLYGAGLGYDRTLGAFVLGAEADVVGSQAATVEAGFVSAADRYITAAVRAGYLVTPRVLTFARGGIANARFSTSAGAFDQTGFTVGGGAEIAVSGNVFVRGEYRYSDYGSVLRGQQYSASLGWRF